MDEVDAVWTDVRYLAPLWDRKEVEGKSRKRKGGEWFLNGIVMWVLSVLSLSIYLRLLRFPLLIFIFLSPSSSSSFISYTCSYNTRLLRSLGLCHSVSPACSLYCRCAHYIDNYADSCRINLYIYLTVQTHTHIYATQITRFISRLESGSKLFLPFPCDLMRWLQAEESSSLTSFRFLVNFVDSIGYLPTFLSISYFYMFISVF